MHNRRYADKEWKISPESVSNLRLKWKFYAGNDTTATPAIFNGTLYFPSWNGYIYAVKASDGSLIWKKNLQKLTGLEATGFVLNVNWTVSRSTPTVAGDLLIVGIYGPAVVIAVERSTGKLVWLTRLDSIPTGVITVSGTYYQGLVSYRSLDLLSTFLSRKSHRFIFFIFFPHFLFISTDLHSILILVAVLCIKIEIEMPRRSMLKWLRIK